METQNNNHPAFDAEAIKWNELEKIGINLVKPPHDGSFCYRHCFNHVLTLDIRPTTVIQVGSNVRSFPIGKVFEQYK